MPAEINKEIYEAKYHKVLEMVYNGYTIKESCIQVGITKSLLYRKMNKQQKAELQLVKTSNRGFIKLTNIF